MDKVEWIRDVVDRLSPANVVAGLGGCVEDAAFCSECSCRALQELTPRPRGTQTCLSSFLTCGAAGLERMGNSLEDLQPRMNPAGTEMGNLTRIMEVKLRVGTRRHRASDIFSRRESARARSRQKDRQRDKERQRKRQRQRDRQGQTDRPTDRQTDRDLVVLTGSTSRRPTNRQTDRQAGRQTDR